MQRPLSAGADGAPAFRAPDVVFDPARAFTALAAAPRFGAPVALMAAGSMAVAFVCVQRLDIDWFKADLIASHPALAAVGRAGDWPITRSLLLVPAVVSAGVNAIAGWLALSFYVLFVARALRRPLTPVQALALGAWAGVPAIVGLMPAALNLALHTDGRLAPDRLDPTTLAAMFGEPRTAFARALAMQLGLADAWTWALRVIGLRAMLGVRRSVAIVLVALPAIAIQGGRAVLSMLGA